MNIDDILAAAESEAPDTRTVKVCVNPAVARKRAALLEALKQAKELDAKASTTEERLGAAPAPTTEHADRAQAELEAFDDEVLKSLITLKFTRLDGERWSNLTAANPMRVDVALDRNYGYNFDAVSKTAAMLTGVRLSDDGEELLTPEQWDRLFKRLSGHDFRLIIDAVWTLNEYAPSQHIEALVKGFGAA
ncbi:hypothetical protein ACSBPH_01570 [Microbacterium sp. F51-2R]|uniref:hypothetical protein n=1 Tax=Microbacterium sp. F51-2R TaxID=3445777 RepID=UPI003FA1898D